MQNLLNFLSEESGEDWRYVIFNQTFNIEDKAEMPAKNLQDFFNSNSLLVQYMNKSEQTVFKMGNSISPLNLNIPDKNIYAFQFFVSSENVLYLNTNTSKMRSCMWYYKDQLGQLESNKFLKYSYSCFNQVRCININDSELINDSDPRETSTKVFYVFHSWH